MSYRSDSFANTFVFLAKCKVHPELKGRRFRIGYKCVGCAKAKRAPLGQSLPAVTTYKATA